MLTAFLSCDNYREIDDSLRDTRQQANQALQGDLQQFHQLKQLFGGNSSNDGAFGDAMSKANASGN